MENFVLYCTNLVRHVTMAFVREYIINLYTEYKSQFYLPIYRKIRSRSKCSYPFVQTNGTCLKQRKCLSRKMGRLSVNSRWELKKNLDWKSRGTAKICIILSFVFDKNIRVERAWLWNYSQDLATTDESSVEIVLFLPDVSDSSWYSKS